MSRQTFSEGGANAAAAPAPCQERTWPGHALAAAPRVGAAPVCQPLSTRVPAAQAASSDRWHACRHVEPPRPALRHLPCQALEQKLDALFAAGKK